MRKLLSITTLLLLFTAFTALDSGIEGTWTAEMQTPNGPAEITYNFKVEGDTLTGTVVGGMGEVEILNGEVNGKEFTFDTSFNGMTISHDCELKNENKITMTFNFGQSDPQELTLHRAEGGDSEEG